MKKSIVLIMLFLSFVGKTQDKFKPSGKIEFTSFVNFSNSQNFNKFELTRAHLGYNYNFSEQFSGRIVFDASNNSAILKYGYLQYEKNGFNLRFGLVPNAQIGKIEKFWNHRYIMKTFQDKYSMATSSDYGIDMYYKFNKFINVVFSVLNGEGYKSSEIDSVFKYCAGVTIHPNQNLIIHTYYDKMKKNIAQQTISLMSGYTTNKFNILFEYNYQANSKYRKNYDYFGYSICGTYNFNKKISIVSRYDMISYSNVWKNSKSSYSEGSQYIFGIEFNPVEGIRISPNTQLWIGDTNIYSFNLNVELKI